MLCRVRTRLLRKRELSSSSVPRPPRPVKTLAAFERGDEGFGAGADLAGEAKQAAERALEANAAGAGKAAARNESPWQQAGAVLTKRCSIPQVPGIFAPACTEMPKATQAPPPAAENDPDEDVGIKADGTQELVWERDVIQLKDINQVSEYYAMGEEIGHGTYGTVYKCTRVTDGHKFAVKVVKKSTTKMYKREAMLSSRVQHLSVLSPKQVFETPNEVLTVTEFCGGGELFNFVADHNLYLGTLTEKSVLMIAREMLVALEACHMAGYAHLDVKSENFVCRIPWSECLHDMEKIRGNLVLIDFGTAQPFRIKRYAASSSEYRQDMDEYFKGDSPLGGTASYVSPEVLYGRFSSRSDIWSLGVTVFMLIAGRRPFDSSFEHSMSVFDREVQKKVKEEAALPLGQSLYSTCEELGLANSSTVDLLLNMMHPEPAKRKSATELIQEIDRMLEEEHPM